MYIEWKMVVFGISCVLFDLFWKFYDLRIRVRRFEWYYLGIIIFCFVVIIMKKKNKMGFMVIRGDCVSR